VTDIEAKTSRWGVGYNLGLLFKQLAKGLVLTLIVVIAIGGLNAYYLDKSYGFSPSEIAVAIVGIVAALAFLQAALLFMGYRIFNGTAFDGSFFVIALLVTFLLIIALGALSFIATPRIDDFPTSELTWLLPAVFGVVTVFLFVTFRASHWMFRR